MREEMSKSIVLTGATGFLGAFLMANLLERGYHVTVLGRSSKKEKLSDRLSCLLQWLDIGNLGKNLSALEVDFSQKHFGLDDNKYRSLSDRAHKIIHCASDTSFAERDRVRVMAANVDNLLSILDFAKDASASHLYYVSTAYVAGRCEGICTETPIATKNFTNVYEESKAKAENIIWRYCENNNMPFSIMRPSIVYGHSISGKSLKFSALYHPVRSLLYTRDIFIKDVIERGGKRSNQWNISLDNNGILHLPLSIYLAHKGTLNLIPVDYFVEAAMSIIEYPDSRGIYHITNRNPTNMTTLAEYSERFLDVRGICILQDCFEVHHKSNPVEELFGKFIEPYYPYLADRRIFDQSRIKDITPNLIAPTFTYDIFERCMSYAIACDWKSTIIG